MGQGQFKLLNSKIFFLKSFNHVFCIYLLERTILNVWMANGIDFTTFMDQDQGQGQMNNASLFNPYQSMIHKLPCLSMLSVGIMHI